MLQIVNSVLDGRYLEITLIGMSQKGVSETVHFTE